MNEGIKRAYRDIQDLYLSDLISLGMRRRAHEFVSYFFDCDTVYASIAPDGDDLTFYWKAGDYSLSVDLYADGGGWQQYRTPTGLYTHTDGLHYEVRHYLREFSAMVTEANPAWVMQTR